MSTAFLGLGNLGRAMAGRLVDQGVDLVVWNRSTGKTSGLEATRAISAAAAAEAASDVVILCLTDSEAVDSVLSLDGFLEACKGKVLLDTTTNHPERVVEFHARVAAAGAAYVECPVAGSVVPASNGALIVLCSGEDAAIERVRPLLEILGQSIHHLPGFGQATCMKLVNNLALGTIMATLAEAVELGECAGLDRSKVIDILGEGGGMSLVMRAKADKLKNQDWSPHFSVAMVRKDLRYLLELAQSLGRESRSGEMSAELYERAMAADLGDLDFSAVDTIVTKPEVCEPGN